MSSVYCTAPFNGLTIREDGHVRTCCSGSVSLGNLNQESIENIQHSPILNQIRESMLKNDFHENCETCVSLEHSSGLSSLREHYLKFYPEHNKFQLKNIDVRWNNTCNLSCMYCTPKFSSTWADRLNNHSSSPVKSYQGELLDFILQRIDEIDEISLVGGEPMLMKQNYELIAKLPGTARISILTNLSYDLERLPCMPKLLSRPRKNTIWNISCENINQQFEYVRNGAKWDQLETNLKFLVRHWPDDVTINMVYSVFGAFDLIETVQRFHQLGIKKFNFQPYYGPSAIDVFSMPPVVQLLAGQILDNVVKLHYKNIHPEDRDFYPLANLDLIKAKLAQAQGNFCSKKEFYNQVAWYDQWSSSKFKDLWPHVIDLVELHLE
jgi:radical SAM protein with 4Fe4S-binding SPASM domain